MALSEPYKTKMILMEIEQLYDVFLYCGSKVSTDSRAIEENCMFFALKGDNFNGNNYAIAALEKGAAVAVIDDEQVWRCNQIFEDRLILVEDVLTTLQQLARYNRLRYKIPVIGLTGTNGKTTTKELISATLGAKYKVVSTIGNLNNHIGVPLTLLRINAETEMAVIEMGASAPGEINLLASLVCPSFGLVTNVGKAHLQGFGSFEGVKQAKGELYDNLQAHKKMAFVNTDNPHLMEMTRKYPKLHFVPYGVKSNCARIVSNEDGEPFLRLIIPNPCLTDSPQEIEIKTKLIGNYNADNVLAALCISSYMAVPTKDAVAAIEAYTPSNNRSQMTRTEHNTLIIDAYNANPTSMRASIENFSFLKAESKVLVLGDMLELGADSVNEHRAIVELLANLHPDRVFLVGAEFGKAVEESVVDGVQMMLFKDSVALREWLAANPLSGQTVLIKGSRGIRLERIIDVL